MTQVSVPVPVPEEVGRHYDEYAALCDVTVGANLHFGYWDTPDSTATFEQAADRLTEVLIDRLPVGPGQHVLDLGCGHGGPAIAVATRTGARVTGVSISREQVSRATARAEAAGVADRVQFHWADATKLPFEAQSFDAVLAFESIIHMPDRGDVLRQVREVLRPGGRVVLTDFYERAPIPREKLPAVQRYLRDFLCTIVQPGDYVPMLADAGLRFLELRDISAETVRQTLVHMSAKLGGARQAELHREYGRDLVEKWNSADMIDVDEFGHIIVVAERWK
ncbi:SAM-dependent methyltransferase [Actinosynnema sp. ALI-1.44]|uniref:SAM-dependent methyltransferase n=1 Tax=Actinosynnema sp. ALI-1.44 TaxID=1933779 RepID=UPI00097C68CB|nr:methyltransferase domain-containing protein [Actinosynnema sp. ALI-1.44]ONI76198.1 SAM-dependent methyltransferase [Actinosynnema sp. ALI-1.44]